MKAASEYAENRMKKVKASTPITKRAAETLRKLFRGNTNNSNTKTGGTRKKPSAAKKKPSAAKKKPSATKPKPKKAKKKTVK